MIDNFQKALQFTLQFEGGLSDNPNDSGGRTMHGIQQRVYDAYRANKGNPQQDVKLISMVEVQDIYYHQYWLKFHCDVIPAQLDIAVFDFAVNAGNEAMTELQRIVGVTVDGVFGAKTQAAVVAACANNTNNEINQYMYAHEKFYKDLTVRIPKDIYALKGWLARTERLRTLLR